MFRLAAALGAILTVGLVAGSAGVHAQDAGGRYELTAQGDGFLRLDTQTGALSFCSLAGDRWVCAPVVSEAPADLTAITTRLDALEAAIADLAARPAERRRTTPPSSPHCRRCPISWRPWPRNRADLSTTPDIAGALAPLEAEIAALRDRIAALADAPAPTVDLTPIEEAIAALGERIDGLETAPPAPVDLGPIEQELAALRDEIAALAANHADGRSDADRGGNRGLGRPGRGAGDGAASHRSTSGRSKPTWLLCAIKSRRLPKHRAATVDLDAD